MANTERITDVFLNDLRDMMLKMQEQITHIDDCLRGGRDGSMGISALTIQNKDNIEKNEKDVEKLINTVHSHNTLISNIKIKIKKCSKKIRVKTYSYWVLIALIMLSVLIGNPTNMNDTLLPNFLVNLLHV